MDLLGLMKNRFCGLLIAGWFSPCDGGLGRRVHDTDRSTVLDGVTYSSSMPKSFGTLSFFWSLNHRIGLVSKEGWQGPPMFIELLQNESFWCY